MKKVLLVLLLLVGGIALFTSCMPHDKDITNVECTIENGVLDGVDADFE